MTSEEFWEGDPEMFWSYRTSFFNKIKAEQERENMMMWIQGAYFFDAISKAIANSFSKGKNYKYIEKPFDFSGKENKKEEVKRKSDNRNNYWASFKSRLENQNLALKN